MNELPNTAIGTLKLMPTTTQQIARFSKMLIEDVQSGNVNPLELLVMLRALERISETVLDAIQSNIDTAKDNYSEKNFDVLGAKVEKSEIAVRYRYETAKDIEWERRRAAVDAAMSLLKEREEFLRTLREPMTAVDTESGEVFTISPPLKASKSGVKVRFV
jgi:hypothetical protein